MQIVVSHLPDELCKSSGFVQAPHIPCTNAAHGLCWKKVMTHPSANFRRPAFIELLHIGVRRFIIAPIDVVPLFPLVAHLSTFVGNGLSSLHCFCCSKFFTRVGRKPTAEPSSFILAWDRSRFCT